MYTYYYVQVLVEVTSHLLPYQTICKSDIKNILQSNFHWYLRFINADESSVFRKSDYVSWKDKGEK